MGLNIFASTAVWIFMAGSLFLGFREKIAGLFIKIPLPAWTTFIFAGFVFSMLEESVNCPPDGCALIPSTWWVFLMFLFIHLGILKLFRVKSFRTGTLIFGGIGWVAEFFLGSSREILWSAPWLTAVMSVWVVLTYSIIMIVPMTIFLKRV